MTTEQWFRLGDTITRFLGTLIWPTTVVFLIVFFRRPLSAFIRSLAEVTLKVAGFEATAKRGPVAAAAALGAAQGSRAKGDGEADGIDDARDLTAALPNQRALRRIQGAKILWVDDRPGNNRFERQALEALGVRVDLSTSTGRALEMLRGRIYRLVISDMNRPPDPNAGYTLLNAIQKATPTPLVFYIGHQTPEWAAEARGRGAQGLTDSPQELITVVTDILANN